MRGSYGLAANRRANSNDDPVMAAMAEILGIDHIYIAVSNLPRSEEFYDSVMSALGFRKNSFTIGEEPHINYFNRQFGFVIRPARSKTPHDSYAPGLHHFCFRVETEQHVSAIGAQLRINGIETSDPQLYPEYAPDYFACFFSDPDGIRFEVTNYRAERRQRHDRWND